MNIRQKNRHTGFHPFEMFLRTVPDSLHTILLCRLINHMLQGQAITARLSDLEGKCLCLDIRDTGNSWRFRIKNNRLMPQTAHCPWDVRIRGSFADFVQLATRREDPDTLFFARRLSLEGDTETGLYIKNLLDAMDFDLQAHLEAVLGSGMAKRLSALPQPPQFLVRMAHTTLTQIHR